METPGWKNQESSENQLHAFPHGKEFLTEAIKYLQEAEVKPEWGKNYRIKPGTETYPSFLAFLIEELENLPFDNQVGKTIEMRSDAKEVIGRLVNYIKKKLAEVSESGKWTNKDLKEIEDIFQQHELEVFKNEIYPEHKTEGIGYNVDLSTVFLTEGNAKPSDVVLERRFVSNSKKFKVLDHGFIKLNLQTGNTHLDLDEFPTSNIHLGN